MQIAGLIARRIVCRVKAGDKLAIGDTYGLIRFGSRLDTYLPDGANVLVEHRAAGRRRRDGHWPSCREKPAHQATRAAACAFCRARRRCWRSAPG